MTWHEGRHRQRSHRPLRPAIPRDQALEFAPSSTSLLLIAFRYPFPLSYWFLDLGFCVKWENLSSIYICTYIIKHRNESFSFHLCNFLGKQTEVKRKLIEREREVLYSLPEMVWRRSKLMMWNLWSFWTYSTTLRFDNRMLDFACCANSNCFCNSSNSSSIFWVGIALIILI